MGGTSDESAVVRLFQLWHGNNYFVCRGFMHNGPRHDWMMQSVAWVGILYCGAVLVTVFASWLPVGAAAAVGALYVALVFFYARASFRDPGVVPPQGIVDLMSLRDGFPHRLRVFQQAHPPVVEALAHSQIVPRPRACGEFHVKRCHTCAIERPPLSSHCRLCNHCVLDFDHHCNYTGNDVARFTHVDFVCFVVLTAAMGWVMLVLCSWHIHTEGFEATVAVLLVIAVIVVLLVTGTAAVHLDIVSTAQTLKIRDREGTPPGMTCGRRLSNLAAFLCRRPHFPRLFLSWREIVVGGAPTARERQQRQRRKQQGALERSRSTSRLDDLVEESRSRQAEAGAAGPARGGGGHVAAGVTPPRPRRKPPDINVHGNGGAHTPFGTPGRRPEPQSAAETVRDVVISVRTAYRASAGTRTPDVAAIVTDAERERRARTASDDVLPGALWRPVARGVDARDDTSHSSGSGGGGDGGHDNVDEEEKKVT